MLDGYGDAVLPDEHLVRDRVRVRVRVRGCLLVVGGCDEALCILAECDRVHGGQVLVVDLLRGRVRGPRSGLRLGLASGLGQGWGWGWG